MSGKRRDKGDGSLFWREDEKRWVGRVKGTDGKTHTISVSLGSLSKAEAKRRAKIKLEEAKNSTTQGANIQRQTVAEYLSAWLEEKRIKLKKSSHESWKKHIRAFIVPVLGDHDLHDLTRAHVQEWVTGMCDSGDLANSSIHIFFDILDLAMKDAVEREILEKSPCFKISLPRREEKEMSILDVGQARRFLAYLATEEHRHEAFFVLAIYTGMRSGEVRALRWTDVDLDKRELTVQRTVVHVDGEGYFENEPKTRNSRRTILLTDEVVTALREHHKKQLKLISKHYTDGNEWEDNNLVFPGQHGGYMAENTPERSLTIILEKMGLPHIRIHDLRHTAATLMLRSGVDIKSVSLMLGHSNIQITMQRYIHILPDMKQEDIKKLSRLLA